MILLVASCHHQDWEVGQPPRRFFAAILFTPPSVRFTNLLQPPSPQTPLEQAEFTAGRFLLQQRLFLSTQSEVEAAAGVVAVAVLAPHDGVVVAVAAVASFKFFLATQTHWLVKPYRLELDSRVAPSALEALSERYVPLIPSTPLK
jgi:hypothetical protein